MKMGKGRWLGFTLVFLAVSAGLPSGSAWADVVRVEVERREVILNGRVWGSAGAYEKLAGKIYFAFDPSNAANLSVVDLQWAPTNADGKVEAWANFMVLQPVDPSMRRGVAWVEVSNRGGKASLRYFNRAPESVLEPADSLDFGDGLLMNQGLTLIWVGWQWDVPEEEGRLRLHVPLARLPGESILGLVRADWTVDAYTETLDLGHRGHRGYSPVAVDGQENVLTVRTGRMAPREVISRENWWFLPPEGVDPESSPDLQMTRLVLEGGFQAGLIYELVYQAKDPRVAGLGLAVVRDVISYAKYELESLFPVNMGVAFGVSQTGRFLRHFVYEGFNTDEGGRKAFDGLLIHTAGGGEVASIIDSASLPGTAIGTRPSSTPPTSSHSPAGPRGTPSPKGKRASFPSRLRRTSPSSSIRTRAMNTGAGLPR